MGPVPPNDVGDGVLAQPEFAPDQAVAAVLRDEGQHLRREAIRLRPLPLALVTAAITLWNSIYVGRALEVLRGRGEVIPDALLAHVAPLGWQHINLTGDYLWSADAGLGPDGFRPLRSTSVAPSTLAAA